jgi:hypothetical protein
MSTDSKIKMTMAAIECSHANDPDDPPPPYPWDYPPYMEPEKAVAEFPMQVAGWYEGAEFLVIKKVVYADGSAALAVRFLKPGPYTRPDGYDGGCFVAANIDAGCSCISGGAVSSTDCPEHTHE